MLAPCLRITPDNNNGKARNAIRHVVLLVPTNTVTNWVDEFEKWNGSSISLYNIYELNRRARGNRLREWKKWGGIVLLTTGIYSNICKRCLELAEVSSLSSKSKLMIRSQTKFKIRLAYIHKSLNGADVFVLDEAHAMLKNKSTQIYKALSAIKTSRRIVLTGTPFQNNLKEYYLMASWLRPNCLGTLGEFEKKYIIPINEGMLSDSTPEQVALQVQKVGELRSTMIPFVQRKGNKILQKDLPPYQQIVLYIQQTKLQRSLMKRYG